MSQSQKTPLYEFHLALQASMAEFGGWLMPMHYGSQLQEHHAVRQQVGIFDVSHMNVVDLEGQAAKKFLQYLLANDVDKLVPGQAIYSAMLNVEAGVIDDLIVYWLGGNNYRLVLNAATHDKDMAWLHKVSADFAVQLTEKPTLAMLALQGPEAIKTFQKITSNSVEHLKPFTGQWIGDWWVARTGYTGEDGLEIILPAKEAQTFWQQCIELGVCPCGLGARDTLRLEAGMNLYGHDMDEKISPDAAGLTWTIALTNDRDFIGKKALLEKQVQNQNIFVGLILEQGGVLREGQRLVDEEGREGIITSGSFSPTLQCSIAFARIPKTMTQPVFVDRRGKLLPVQLVKLPFVRKGKTVFKKLHLIKEEKHV